MSNPAANLTRASASAARRRLKTLLTRWVVDPLVRLLAATGVTPDALTLLGFAGSGAAGIVLATGHLVAGGAVVLAGSALDMLDGALARATHTESTFGALLDSTVDRLAEAAILSGLLYHFTHRGETEEVLLVFAVMTGSVLVSYVKARAEGLGLECNVGIVTRPERVILLGVGLLVSQVTGFLYVIAILSFATAGHRFLHAAKQTRKG